MKKTIAFAFLLIFSSSFLYGQAFPDRHNTSWTDTWISCETAPSPNIKREAGHWIMYDLGDQYVLQESKFWNINIPEDTDKGIQDYEVDVSINGQDWIQLGRFTLDEGPANAFYEGSDGPDFDGAIARYVLITAISNYGDACYGLSEIKINATTATTTATDDQVLDIDLAAQPNPADDYTTITVSELYKEMKYSLINSQGQVIVNGLVSQETFTIQTASLPAGIYTLLVNTSDAKKALNISVIR